MELKNLKDYIIDISETHIRMTKQRVAYFNVYDVLEKQLVSLTCSRIWKGLRLMQTTCEKYRRELSIYLYIIDNYELTDKEKQYYINKLLDLHENNLAFERENPPIDYDDGFKKSANKHPRRKQQKQQASSELDRQISAKQSLKQKVAQFGKLTFKITPKSNGKEIIIQNKQ